MANISYKASMTMTNRYGFNGGNEYEDEGELNYSNTFYRKYDAQIGRFTGVDIKAEATVGLNPYQFGNNNPVMFNDPMGDLSNLDGKTGRSTKGPDGNYHTGWVTEMMWGNLGFFNDDYWGDGGGGGGFGGGGSNYRNIMGMSSSSILNQMGFGQSFGQKKNGEYGFWSSYSFRPTDRGYKDAAATSSSLAEVSVGGGRTWIPFDGIKGLSYQFGINRNREAEGGLGIRIKLGYNDEAGYKDLNWVQTVTTNKPLSGKSWQSRDGFDANPTRYYSYTSNRPGENIADHTNKDGFSVDFFDSPLGDISEGIWWNAELSLVGQKDGNYSTLFTIQYGFSFDKGGTGLSSYIGIQQSPSLFQIIATVQPSNRPVQIPYRR
jgi:RHS repeat-associated protein